MVILRTLRSSVDWQGQVITMVDRAYLAEGIPTLIIWGRRDAIIPLGHGRLIHTVMPGSEFEIFDEAGHFPHHTDPARFVRVLREFMERSMPATYDAQGWRDRLLGERLRRHRGPGRRTRLPRRVPRGSGAPLGRVPDVDGSEDEAARRCCTAAWPTAAWWCGWAPTCCGRRTRTRRSIFAFLREVRTAGFGGVPRPAGIDADGRERLEFIEGDAPAAPYPRVGPGGRSAGVGGGAHGPLPPGGGSLRPRPAGALVERRDRRLPRRPHRVPQRHLPRERRVQGRPGRRVARLRLQRARPPGLRPGAVRPHVRADRR